MFGGVRRAWREARATELQKEVEDTFLRMNAQSEELKFVSISTLMDILRQLESRHGDIMNVSQKMHHEISKKLYAQARSIYHTNVSGASGVFLAGAFVESRSLPGEAGNHVRSLLDEFVAAARLASAGATDHPSEMADFLGVHHDLTKPLGIVLWNTKQFVAIDTPGGTAAPTSEQAAWFYGVCDAATQRLGYDEATSLQFTFGVFEEAFGQGRGGKILEQVIEERLTDAITAGGSDYLADRHELPFR